STRRARAGDLTHGITPRALVGVFCPLDAPQVGFSSASVGVCCDLNARAARLGAEPLQPDHRDLAGGLLQVVAEAGVLQRVLLVQAEALGLGRHDRLGAPALLPRL